MKGRARFWTLGPDACPVRLSLAPGQTLERAEGGPDEEGWSHRLTQWRHDGDRIVRSDYVTGQDCDGRHEFYCVTACWLDELTGGAEVDGARFPLWHEIERSQRDHSAEAAGY